MEYNLAGLDDTWVDSGVAGPSTPEPGGGPPGQGGEDSDSDMSDVIPQYDGANDEIGEILYMTIEIFSKLLIK